MYDQKTLEIQSELSNMVALLEQAARCTESVNSVSLNVLEDYVARQDRPVRRPLTFHVIKQKLYVDFDFPEPGLLMF